MKKIAVVLLLALAVGVWALWLWRKPGAMGPVGAGSAGQGSASAVSGPAAAPSPSMPPAAATVSPVFLRFLAEEARALDGTQVNAAAAERRLQAQADAMGPGEVEHLKALALGKASPANQKILAVHLLGRAGPKAWAALSDILAAAVAQEAPPQHSVEEVRWMQERALREMALEALLEQASKDPRAAELLRVALEKTSDPAFAARVRKKLQDLEPAGR